MMAHPNVIDVKTCKLDSEVLSARNFPVVRRGSIFVCTGGANNIRYLNTDDVNFRWKVRLGNKEQTSNMWLETLIAENRTYSKNSENRAKRAKCQDDEKQDMIVGEATFDIERDSSPNNRTTKKYYFLKSISTDTDICCCTLVNDNIVEWDNLKLTINVSYLHLNDIIPILTPNRYAIVPTTSATKSFENAYLNKKHSDVTLCVNGTDYYAHKIILEAYSTVFKAMFEHDMEEKRLNKVEIKDINESAFLQALRYMYTGEIENAEELASEILPVADRYNIEGLKTLCGEMLQKQLSPKTVLQILLMADSYNEDSLKTNAIEFLNSHSKDVDQLMSSEDWETIMARPRLMKDVMHVLMSAKR